MEYKVKRLALRVPSFYPFGDYSRDQNVYNKENYVKNTNNIIYISQTLVGKLIIRIIIITILTVVSITIELLDYQI